MGFGSVAPPLRRAVSPLAVLLALWIGGATGGCGPGREGRAGAPAQFPELSPPQAARLLEERAGDAKFVLLDVRTPAEFAEERIAGSGNLDFHAPRFRAELAKLDRERTYLVCCRTGNRSG